MRSLLRTTRRRAFWAIGMASFILAACQVQSTETEMKPGMKMEMATEGLFEGSGEVITLVPDKTQIVVSHEEIKGFMKAMPMGMGYDVESDALLTGLQPGDKIKFTIDAAKKKIVVIGPLE